MTARRGIFTNLILLYLLLTAARGEEPHCSKYDFEEKLLEKVIRLEFAMEKMNSEVLDSLDLMKNLHLEVERSTKSLNETLADLNVTKNKMIQELQSAILAAEGRTRLPTVVFKARSNGTMDVQQGKALVFPTIIVNEGSGYDAGSGIFTASVDGTYSFSITFCVNNGRDLHTAIIVNGTQYSGAAFGDQNYYACYSTDAVAVVKATQKVWVQVVSGSGTGTGVIRHDETYCWNTFSGLLVNA